MKFGSGKFNQVDADQSQEWLNGTGKNGGGIIGITKNVYALSRWALSFNLRSDISKDTKAMFGIDTGSVFHKEHNISRRREDTSCEGKVKEKLLSYGIFSDQPDNLVMNIPTKDKSTQ